MARHESKILDPDPSLAVHVLQKLKKWKVIKGSLGGYVVSSRNYIPADQVWRLPGVKTAEKTGCKKVFLLMSKTCKMYFKNICKKIQSRYLIQSKNFGPDIFSHKAFFAPYIQHIFHLTWLNGWIKNSKGLPFYISIKKTSIGLYQPQQLSLKKIYCQPTSFLFYARKSQYLFYT